MDARLHLGPCRVFDLSVTEDDLVGSLDGQGRVGLVMPFLGAPDAASIHDRIASLAKDRPGQLFGIVNLDPHIGREAYETEARRCVDGLGFVALKLHTIGYAMNPLSEDAGIVFDVAREHDVPVFVHTGPGIPYDRKWFVSIFGPERVMFGSDLLMNVTAERAKYDALGLTAWELEQCLGGTSTAVVVSPSGSA